MLIFPILSRHHENSAHGYLAAQVVQGVMLAVGIVFLLLLLLLRIPLAQQYPGAGDGLVPSALARFAQEGNHYSFWVGMLSVGVGGLVLCRVLLRERLVPAFMAVYGLAGYVVFLAGAVLEILGHNVGGPCPSRAASSRSPSECCSSRKASPRGKAKTVKDRTAARRLLRCTLWRAQRLTE